MLYGTSLHEPSSNWSASIVLLSVHDSVSTKHSVGMGWDVKDKKVGYRIAEMSVGSWKTTFVEVQCDHGKHMAYGIWHIIPRQCSALFNW